MSILAQQEIHVGVQHSTRSNPPVTITFGPASLLWPYFTEVMFDGDMMEQKELVPMEQGKEEGDDQQGSEDTTRYEQY